MVKLGTPTVKMNFFGIWHKRISPLEGDVLTSIHKKGCIVEVDKANILTFLPTQLTPQLPSTATTESKHRTHHTVLGIL